MKLFILILCAILALGYAQLNQENLVDLDEELRGIEFLENFLPKNVSGRKYCPTEDIWKWKQAVRAASAPKSPFACATQGACDNYLTRNRYVGLNVRIPLYITTLCSTSTSCAGGVTSSRINDQLAQINRDFAGTGFTFHIHHSRFVVDATNWEIAAYSQSSNTWYNQLNNIKRSYAVDPDKYLNVFITGQKSGTQGTLLGIGTFPWDSAALTATGGLWLNANYVRAGDKTASHEIGHNIGLWHTFHGDSEVACTNGCYEVVHEETSSTSAPNDVGDHCADTPAQPMNYNCQYPTGRDCKNNLYTKFGNSAALINNIMAYTPDSCMVSFTAQQAMRAHCWVCAKLQKWLSTSDCKTIEAN